VFLKDRLRPLQVGGLLLGFVGVGVAAGFGAGDLGHSSVFGSLAAVVAGLFYAMAFVYMRRNLIGIQPIVAATGQLIMATALALPFAVATSATGGLELSVRRVLAIGTLGVVGTGIAYLLNYRIIADVGATRASLVTYLIPVVAVTVGVVVLGEHFEWRLVAGGVLIVAGIALLRERRTLRLPIPSSTAVVLVLALLLLPLAACGSSGGATATCQPAHAEALNPSLNHVLAGSPEPQYTTDPPTSGPHTPGAPPASVLTSPLSRPSQVGALESGDVLLQYRDLSAAERSQLERLAASNVVVAPNPALPDRIVATAWLFKQTCTAVDTATLRTFVHEHAGHGPGSGG
jgi:uncharacterized membrane protein